LMTHANAAIAITESAMTRRVSATVVVNGPGCNREAELARCICWLRSERGCGGLLGGLEPAERSDGFPRDCVTVAGMPVGAAGEISGTEIRRIFSSRSW
jgi:hypothetical protein